MFITKWATCNVIYAQQNKHKKSEKGNNTRVAMLTWSTNDVFLSVFQWTYICRCFEGILCFIQSSHATALSHISLWPCHHQHDPVHLWERRRVDWWIHSFQIQLNSSWGSLVKIKMFGTCSEKTCKMKRYFSCNASQMTFWSCKNYWSMVIHLFSHFTCPSSQFFQRRLEQATETWSASVCSISFCIKMDNGGSFKHVFTTFTKTQLSKVFLLTS